MEGTSVEEYNDWLESQSYAEKVRGFYELYSDLKGQDIEAHIEGKNEEELKGLYERLIRMWQDKQAYLRGDKTHIYSQASVLFMDKWDEEK